MALELSTTGFLRADRDGKVMSQQLPSWRTGNGQTLWLSMLIEAMEKLSRSEWRGRTDRRELAAICARLAQPAMARRNYESRFGLRN
jgi:hypothetical protein